MKNISKEYFGNRVLKEVNLSVKAGEIHALLGENGAGKSTLMNVLFGMPVIHETGGYEGEVIFDGKQSSFSSPKEAMDQGIGMVHQEFMLIPGYSITENIKLNREITKGNLISKILHRDRYKTVDLEQMSSDARVALDRLEMNIDEFVQVAGLPVGYMQFIEIAREIDKKNIKLLVFDEPTAVLTESEALNLMDAMKKLAESGIAILFITHRLDEVMHCADTVTILRDGEFVASKPKTETSVIELAELMVGRKIEIINKGSRERKSEKVMLELKNFSVEMPGERVNGIDLKVYEGEILGIGGLAGHGKIGIANGVMGLYPASGEILLDGEELKLNSPKDSLQAGVAFVSEDRRGIGLLLDSSIEDNIVVTSMQAQNKFLKDYTFFKLRDKAEIRRHALAMIERYDIRCTGPTQFTRRLSGGNQQKVCLARAVTLNPKLFLVSEPTRGIDIGAKKLVLDNLIELNKKQGMTIIMTSSELAELRSICDRIAIINEGKLVGVLQPEASDADFGLMMSGAYKLVKEGKDGTL
ncbi:MAG: sugar ABC transporter ATP-binding protein [Eubacteriales bacterium]|nr:sugar ABC transporter ATP-binding protein [Eubacteriales bacterium]